MTDATQLVVEAALDSLEHDVLSPLSSTCTYSESRFEDCEGLTRRERILLRPWLESLIDSGQVPGLEWIERSNYIFKVPWKHRSKKSWSVEHSSVFLEWAKNTGRWREGDPEPNYAQLKTRLRCAFNKAPDIQEVKELHRTKCEEAYKVYRFVPKKESRFGSVKKKMLIPTSVKRKRFSWINWGRVQKLKQEEINTTMSEIKREPKCGSPGALTGDATVASNVPYQCVNYCFNPKNPTVEKNDCPASPPVLDVRTAEIARSCIEDHYATVKYQKLQEIDRSALYGERVGGDQVCLQNFSDVAVDAERRITSCLESAVTLQNNPFARSDGYEGADSTYGKYYLKHHDQSSMNSLDAHGKRQQAFPVYDYRGQRSSYRDSEEHHLDRINFADASHAANDSLSNVYMEQSRTDNIKTGCAISTMHPRSQFQPGLDSFQLDDSSSYRRFGNDHEYPSSSGYEFSGKLRRPLDVHLNQMLLSRENSVSSDGRQVHLEPRPFSSCVSARPTCDVPMHDSFDGSQYGKPPLEVADCQQDPCAAGKMNYKSPCDAVPQNYADKQEACRPTATDKKIYDPAAGTTCRVDTKSDSYMQGFQEGNAVPIFSKIAAPNVLDLTKKVKVAVAPFIANRQAPEGNNLLSTRECRKLSQTSIFLEKLNEQLNNPNSKVLDLIEWERRLIERERELLARERLMTLKEKNLRELELAFQLNRKPDFGQDANATKSKAAYESFEPRTRRKTYDKPPPLSPLNVPAGDRGFGAERSRVFYKHDSSPSDRDSEEERNVCRPKLFSGNYGRSVRGEDVIGGGSKCKLFPEQFRTDALFIDNAREDRTLVTRILPRKRVSLDALVIPCNKDLYKPCISEVMDSNLMRKGQNLFVEKHSSDEEPVKVLPVVDYLSSEEVLHIAKLPDKMAEMKGRLSEEKADVDYSFKSPSTEKESSMNGGVHEEVWKRRLKWKSFQGLQNSASQVKSNSTSNHWIWPNIGNLNQTQEQTKVDEGN